jgi:hypothetical protein
LTVKSHTPRSTSAICVPSPAGTAGSPGQARPTYFVAPLMVVPSVIGGVSDPEVIVNGVLSVVLVPVTAYGPKSSSAATTYWLSAVNSASCPLPSGTRSGRPRSAARTSSGPKSVSAMNVGLDGSSTLSRT